MRVLVTGASGQLGVELSRLLDDDPRTEVIAADRHALPVDDARAVDDALGAIRPHMVIHAAAMTDVDRCEGEPAAAEAVNAVGTRNVARAAAQFGAHLLYVSTDYVFDGHEQRPYVEDDEPHPLSVYGVTKLSGERHCPPEATIVRTSWVAGAYGPNFVATVLGLGAASGELRFVADQRSSPTFTQDLAPALVALAEDRRPGRFHVTNAGEASRFELARETLAVAALGPERAVPIATSDLVPPRAATRPAYSVLDNAAFEAAGYAPLPPWRESLAQLVAQIAEDRR